MTAGSIRVGIGGWTYEPWRGLFYPPDLPHRRELAYAARAVTAIEINATYYGRQKPESFAKWASETPEGFRFTVKASRFSTARKVLAESASSVEIFLQQGFTRLGDRLGPILWQFPEAKRFERDDFARFLDLLPDRQDGLPLRHALEVRHESFRVPAFLDLARARNMAVVLVDSEGVPLIDAATADFVYARLERSAADCPTGYGDAAIEQWAARAEAWARAGRDVYLFFIAGAKERNPVAARALLECLRR